MSQPTVSAESPPAFELRDIVVIRGGATILDRVSLRIPQGVATAVVGPSGSGKTSLLRLLNRFEEPDEGVVSFQGEDARSIDVLRLRRQVGLVAQRSVLLADNVGAEVRVGRPDLPDDAVVALLRRVGLARLSLDRGTTGLSGGESQLLALARALALDPTVLLLDEPTSALDAEAAEAVDEVIDSLVAAGLTVVVVSHDVHRVAAVARHAVVLAGGRVVESGAPESVAYWDSYDAGRP